MPVCVPIKDMRDTAKFSALVESSPTPVTVTKNGYSKFVVMRAEDYDLLIEGQARSHLLARLAVAERERADGTARDALAHLDELERAHGL